MPDIFILTDWYIFLLMKQVFSVVFRRSNCMLYVQIVCIITYIFDVLAHTIWTSGTYIFDVLAHTFSTSEPAIGLKNTYNFDI